jgi:hypothetical protein
MTLKSGVIIALLNDIYNLPHDLLKIHKVRRIGNWQTWTHDLPIIHSFEVGMNESMSRYTQGNGDHRFSRPELQTALLQAINPLLSAKRMNQIPPHIHLVSVRDTSEQTRITGRSWDIMAMEILLHFASLVKTVTWIRVWWY